MVAPSASSSAVRAIRSRRLLRGATWLTLAMLPLARLLIGGVGREEKKVDPGSSPG